MVIVDFEGYQYKEKFYIKEIAFLDINSDRVCNLFIKTPVINGSTYNFLVKYHHQIPHYYFTEKFKNILKYLRTNQTTFIVKGLSKVKILRKYTNNKIIDLETLGCSKLKDLKIPSNKINCSFVNHLNNPHCALLKVQKLKNWIYENEKSKPS